MLPHSSDQTNLSADVPPFVPRKEFQNDSAHAEQGPSPLPRYVTTCYPFVQEQQNGRVPVQSPVNTQFVPMSYIGDSNPIHPSPIPASHNPIVVPVVPTASGFPAHAGDGISLSYNDVLRQSMPNYYATSPIPKHKGAEKSSKRIARKSVATQKEATANNEGGSPDRLLMVDSCQQTDFPVAIATKSLKERPSPLKKLKSRRHRTAHASNDEHESSSDYADADIDSDSGYYSPKHRMVRKRSGGTSTTELTSGFANNQNGGSSAPVSRVVYLAPSPTLYPMQHPLGQPVMPGVLSPHPTPPPGPSLLLTPPATPILNQNPVISRPPPGFPPPPNFIKSQAMWPGQLLGAQPPFAGPNLPPHLLPPGQYYQFVQRPRNRRPNTSPKHQSRWPSTQNMQSSSSMQDQRSESSFDKRKQDKRKVNVQEMVNNQSVPFENGVTPQDTASILLSDTQEFPGLGSPSVVNQMLLVSNQLSYSDAVLGKTILHQPTHPMQVKQASNMAVDDQSMQEKLQAQKNRKRQKKAERASKAADEEYAEISQEQENIQKALKKTAANRNRNKPSKMDLGEILSQQLKSKVAASKIDSADGETSTNAPRSGFPHKETSFKPKSSLALPVNPLDSSSPLIKRGKEKENPKPKKPSALKKVILKEREEKKGHHLKQLTSYDHPDRDVPPYPPAIIDTLKSQSHDDGIDNLMENITSVPQIHSRRYREYCSQVLDKRIDEACTIILQKLVQFQDRLYQKDPMKAKIRRRLVMGIREVTKHLKLKKLKCVIVSPNLEKIQSKGGLDEALQQILEMCESQNVTYVFALGRKAMGRAVSKLVPVSIVGIFDYSGAEDHYKEMCSLVIEAQQKYKEMVSIYQQEVIDAASTTPKSNAPAPSGGTSKRFAHMGHSRNPSAASCVSFASFISEPISEMNEGSNWRAIMDAQEEQSTLSPPPEVESSDEEQSGGGVQNARGEKHDDLCRKDSGSTVVEFKETQLPGITDEDQKSNDDHMKDLSCSLSSIHEEVSTSASKNLDKSFSNSSTVVGALLPPGGDTTATRGQQDADQGIIGTIDESSEVQDRVQMWLENSTHSIQEMNLDSDPPEEDEDKEEETSSLDAVAEDEEDLCPEQSGSSEDKGGDEE